MYYRRKILLSLLQAFDGEADKMIFQKFLFLISRQQKEKSYHFVPYKYGCFSFQANADLNTLKKYNLVKESENRWERTDKTSYLSMLKTEDRIAIVSVFKQFSKYSKDELLKYTYLKYPYYAINSTIAGSLLNASEFAVVSKQKAAKKEIVRYTIGYEGISLEEYLNKLIINDVRLLCDVRKNALSMKYGFSKSQFQKACNGVGIAYLHIPEVGIETDKRRFLNTQTDYDSLFKHYIEETIKREQAKLIDILSLLNKEKRIALTCFESNIRQCHRKHLAESVALLPGFNYNLKHI